MNDRIRESTKEKGQYGELYAIVEANGFRTHYIFSEALIEVKDYDYKTDWDIWKIMDGKGVAIQALYHADVLYRNERVISKIDILASTV